MDDTMLIVEVEKHRELYDPQHPFYKDNIVKERAWEEVSAVVGPETSTMSKRVRTEVYRCCLSTATLSLLYPVIMSTVCAKDLLPCSHEVIDLVEGILKDTAGMNSIEVRLYTPNETDYEKCLKSTLTCFAEEVNVLVYHNPALHESDLTRRLMYINTREDIGYCPQCEANNVEPVEKFLKNLKYILQQINAQSCGEQP